MRYFRAKKHSLLRQKNFAYSYEALTGKKASEFDDFKNNFNKFLENNICFTVQCGGVESQIYPLAHCGNGGTMSRNKIFENGKWIHNPRVPKNDQLLLQREDWERIKYKN